MYNHRETIYQLTIDIDLSEDIPSNGCGLLGPHRLSKCEFESFVWAGLQCVIVLYPDHTNFCDAN